jgi:hypothetical protein
LEPKADESQLSGLLPPHRRKRKSEELVNLPPDIVEQTAEALKRTKISPDLYPPQQVVQQVVPSEKSYHPEITGTSVPVKAVFENGMRVTEGRGRMTNDYIGVVLPLLEEYQPTEEAPAQAPWLKLDDEYLAITDGFDRYVLSNQNMQAL